MTVALQISGHYCEIVAPYKAQQLLTKVFLAMGHRIFEGQYNGPLLVYNHLLAQIQM